jgi:hypothetical protein
MAHSTHGAPRNQRPVTGVRLAASPRLRTFAAHDNSGERKSKATGRTPGYQYTGVDLADPLWTRPHIGKSERDANDHRMWQPRHQC